MSHEVPEVPSTPAQAKAESSSLGELLGDVTRDMSTLMRQEVELAKVELKQSASRAG
ncbi:MULTISPECIES: phage holin family protein, partial [unclassified Arthrobacter]|uniref:phage holin family protein n=1 Tax=unclassified Arthrobacter TaxID=235627 RepID=UPI002E00399A